MNESLGPPGLTHHSVPSLPSVPDGLDDRALLALARELRQRLMVACADLRSTDQRRDWLLHMTLQTHHPLTILELIDEFNRAQWVDQNLGYELIEVGFHELGLYFKRRTLQSV